MNIESKQLEPADVVINRLGALLSMMSSVDFANAVANADKEQNHDRNALAHYHSVTLASTAEWLRVAGEQRAEWAKFKAEEKQ